MTNQLLKSPLRILRAIPMMLVFLFSLQSVYAQQDFLKTVDLLPPTPDAIAITKFGGINVNLSTGAINKAIPLYDYKSRDIQFPLSIQYYSTGLKVDEIASRVGTSWTLNAGGAISRMVNGKDDFRSTRAVKPANYPQRTRAFIDFLKSINSGPDEGSITDGEPDLFSFNVNGLNGQFVYNDSGAIVMLTHNNLKISGGESGYTITDDLGIRYIFGGVIATEQTKKLSSCGKTFYNTASKTAWYLTQIIHPNRDTVWFDYEQVNYTYTASLSQVAYAYNSGDVNCDGYQVSPPQPVSQTCENILQTNQFKLVKIRSTTGAIVNFYYKSRMDTNDQLVDSITCARNASASQVFKTIKFNYTLASPSNRPFLTTLIDKGVAGAQLSHRFTYNSINSVPSYLAFSKDHFGYFNGKSNTTMLPTPVDMNFAKALPTATADREPDAVAAQKGMLTSITYPTGGIDSIDYEGNTVKETRTILPSYVVINANASSASLGGTGTSQSTAFNNSILQQAEITLKSASNTDPNDPNHVSDPFHNKGEITLTNTNTNQILVSEIIDEGENFASVINLPVGNYTLTATARGIQTTATVTVKIRGGAPVVVTSNFPVCGLRVARVKSWDGANPTSSIKRYLYESDSLPGWSSALLRSQPVYEKFQTFILPCMNGDCTHSEGCLPSCGVSGFAFYFSSSSPINNIFAFEGSAVTYRKVIETDGENFGNGGIEHTYTASPNLLNSPIIGAHVEGAPATDYTFQNGKETTTYVFKKINGVTVPVSRTETKYRLDTRRNQVITGYITNKKYNATCQRDPTPDQAEIDAWDMEECFYIQNWMYPDTVITKIYDLSGTMYQENKTVYTYANPVHAFPTKIDETNSRGQARSTQKLYVLDKVLTGQEETDRQAMISLNQISPVLESNLFVNAVLTQKSIAKYQQFQPNMILPRQTFVQNGSGALYQVLDFPQYNAFGKIIQQSKVSDFPTSYVWSDNSSQLIASVSNATSAQVAYTSFETDAHGSWTYSNEKIFTPSLSGRMADSLYAGNTITKTSLQTASSYWVSYWTRNAVAFSITGTQSGYPQKGLTMQGWTYYVHLVTGVSQVQISGTGWIDELRLYPNKALMAGYAYDEIDGVITKTDDNNVVENYEYDDLSRLTFIRDGYSNIRKKFCYSLASSPGVCGDDTAANWLPTGNLQCKPCPANGTYMSNIEQRQEKNANTLSASYGSLRWIDQGVSSNCGVVEDWQFTATATRCKKYSDNKNTQEQEREQKDMNPCSPTYNQLRWVVTGTDSSACGPWPHVKLTYDNVVSDQTQTTATYYISVFQDPAGTIPMRVYFLNVGYSQERTDCNGNNLTTQAFTKLVTGQRVSLGTFTKSFNDGTNCWKYKYSISARASYSLVNN
jgi:YD repeat-containing protein